MDDHTANNTCATEDMLALSARHYCFKPLAIFFNAFQLRAYRVAGMELNSPVLDIGCSNGGFGVLLGEAFGRPEEMVGIDPMQGALDAADDQARAVYREMICASATKLPFPDQSFKTVVANASLFAIKPGLDEAIAEMSRVLQPGGVLYATVCTDQYDQYYWLTRLLNRVGCSGLARRYADSMNARQMQWHMLSAREWQEQIKRGGFTVRQCVGFMPFSLIPFWSFLAWTPFRVHGVLRYIPFAACRRWVASFYTRLFRKRYETTPPLHPPEESGYIFIEAVKQ